MKVEVWGTVEYKVMIDVPDDNVSYEDVFDYCTYHLDIKTEDLGDVKDINVVYNEEE